MQEARKQAGLEVSDRIRLRVVGSPAIAAALAEHREYVMEETLSHELLDNGAFGPEYEAEHRLDDDEHWSIGLARVKRRTPLALRLQQRARALSVRAPSQRHHESR